MKYFVRLLVIAVISMLFASTASASDTRYNDAVNVGKMLNERNASLESAINSGDIKKIHTLYDDFTNYISKTEKAIGKVSRKTKRDKLMSTYVKPAKVTRERVIYEVSQYRLIHQMKGLYASGKIEQAKKDFAKLERLKKRSVEIKKKGGYKSLPSKIDKDLAKLTDRVKNTLFNGGTKRVSIEEAEFLILHDHIDSTEVEVKIIFFDEQLGAYRAKVGPKNERYGYWFLQVHPYTGVVGEVPIR
ncbi:hypothetical protein ABET41_10490 [Metabacillus fastidiosus]|uniref:SbsC C-terminal domain-containing protein n=1 Tax=Metabacillus fastidiosus TaxID=1458 RepID=A0ABU6NS72_9BACI|nr:hypothetical protein [Metabacillus fastidiosus]MED4399990.1 hypothetical protein [Metabacillus fastidiosus]MED4462474.1 hypothetical protein [Metabacillus fastidiosus]